MGVKRLLKGASGFVRKDFAAIGKLMVKQGGIGSVEPVMVPSPHEPLRIEAVGQPLPQRDGHLGTVSVLDRTRRTEGQDQESTRVLF